MRHDVLNLGVCGYNTEQELALLEEKGLKYNPDMVVLLYLYNDINYADLREGEAGSGSSAAKRRRPTGAVGVFVHRVKNWLADVAFSHTKALLTFKFRAARPGGVATARELAYFPEHSKGWQRTQEALGRLFQLGKDRGVRTMVFLLPYMTTDPQLVPSVSEAKRLNEPLRVFCRAHGVPFHDLIDAMLADGRAETRRISRVDAHPNRAGHRVIGEEMYRIVAHEIGLADTKTVASSRSSR